MKCNLTEQEELLAEKIYDELGGMTIARAKVVLQEVNRLLKEVTVIIEEKTKLEEVIDPTPKGGGLQLA